MKILRLAIVILLLVAMITTGCDANSDLPEGNVPDINPNAEAANKDTSSITLYFSYRDENLLAGETRTIDVPVSDTLETAVVRALIEGPVSDELSGLFWPGVKLIDVDANSNYASIYLSEEFVTTTPDKKQSIDALSINEQKKLAIYSIVNTIIEMGQYSRVQIYVAGEGGIGQRITLGQAGWSDDDAYLEPLEREPSLILTADNTLHESLSSFAKKDWTRLYTFTANTDVDGTKKPSIEDFSEALAEKGNVLESFNIVGQNVSSDGQTAIVMLDYTIKTREGNLIENTNVPIVLVREKDIWKLTYPSLVNVLINI